MSTRTRVTVLAAVAAMSAAGLGVAATDATAAVPRCGNDSLTTTSTFVQGAAGHSYLSLIYRNATTRTCTLAGYPGVDAITSSGHVLAHATRHRNATPLRTVTLRRGGYASASVSWQNFTGPTGRSCRTSAAIETIAANTTARRRLPVKASVCGLVVNPTVNGLPGYPHYAPAQHDWITAAQVDAARMNQYIEDAAYELKQARVYPTQVQQLEQLASFPLTGLNPTQIKQARADVAALNAFFATPNRFA